MIPITVKAKILYPLFLPFPLVKTATVDIPTIPTHHPLIHQPHFSVIYKSTTIISYQDKYSNSGICIHKKSEKIKLPDFLGVAYSCTERYYTLPSINFDGTSNSFVSETILSILLST